MRRRALALVVLAAVFAALTACGTPAGTDRDLVDDWPAVPEAKLVLPTAPACYVITESEPTAVTRWPEPVGCTTPHNVELVHVGQFIGADADAGSPPGIGSPARRKAYEECADKAKTYLGDDWRVGRLELALDVPIPPHWDAGARWFRCDVQELKNLDDRQVLTRSASLKDGLAGTSDLRLGCLTITQLPSREIDKMQPVSCTAPHNGEFAGVWEAPDTPYPTDADTRRTANLTGCRGVSANYAGIPDDSNFPYRTGQVAVPFNKAAWELGNRGVRCYIWPPNNVSVSLRGAGTAGLPINVG